MSRMIEVAIGDLHASRSNVRELYDPATDKKLPELVASIRSLGGLIQPLAVAKRKKGGGYEVIAGQRRTAALKVLAAEDAEKWSTVDAVEISDPKLFSEASLAENYARAQMTLPQIYTAFGRIRAERPNATLEELGAMFGFDAARAGRVMRLAALSHKVMGAYRAGEIDDAQAQAFAAVEDQKLQDQVLEQLAGQAQYNRGPVVIRRLLGLMDRDQREVLTFVGREVYVDAGGGFLADLFNEGEGKLLDPELLTRLFNDKMEALKDAYIHRLQRGKKRVVVDGQWGIGDLKFSWSAQPPQITQYGSTSDDWELRIRNPKLTPLSDDDAATVRTLEARIEALNDHIEEQDITGDEAPEIVELAGLEKQREEIDDRRYIMLPAKGDVVGVAKLENGQFSVSLWYASRKDKGVDGPANGKATGANQPQSEGEKMRRRVGVVKDGAHALFLARRDMVRDNLVETASTGSMVAHDFLIYSQARAILNVTEKTYYSGGPVYRTLSGHSVGIENPASQDEGGTKPPKKVRDVFERLTVGQNYRRAVESLQSAAWVKHPDPINGWHLFRAADAEEQNSAAAIVACHGIMASLSFYDDGATPRMIEELALSLEQEAGFVQWPQTIQRDEAFFALINHRRRQELLIEWGGPDVAAAVTKAKAGETAAMCAAAVPADWLPEILVAKMPEPLPEPKVEEPTAESTDDEPFVDPDDVELAGN